MVYAIPVKPGSKLYFLSADEKTKMHVVECTVISVHLEKGKKSSFVAEWTLPDGTVKSDTFTFKDIGVSVFYDREGMEREVISEIVKTIMTDKQKEEYGIYDLTTTTNE